MQKITNSVDLKSAIRQLENKQEAEWIILNDQFMLVRESLHPLQLLKKTFSEVIYAPAVKDNLLGTVMGLTAGFISKALVIGSTHNPAKMLIGALLQLKVSNAVAKNAAPLTIIAGNLLNFLGRKTHILAEKKNRSAELQKDIF